MLLFCWRLRIRGDGQQAALAYAPLPGLGEITAALLCVKANALRVFAARKNLLR
jgi:hypothetical protein